MQLFYMDGRRAETLILMKLGFSVVALCNLICSRNAFVAFASAEEAAWIRPNIMFSLRCNAQGKTTNLYCTATWKCTQGSNLMSLPA